MLKFNIKAKKDTGEVFDEQIEAKSRAQAVAMLQERHLTILEMKEAKSDILNISFLQKVTAKELSLFAKQIAQLVKTGVSMHRSIELIAQQIKNKYFKEVLEDIIGDIKTGSSVSRAMEKHPKVFPEMVVHQLRSAESGGFIEEAFMNISHHYERDAAFKKQVKGAMTYPVIVLLVTIGILYFMLTKIVPTLSATLLAFDAELPVLTTSVIAVSEFVMAYWLYGTLGVGGIGFAAWYLLRDDNNRRIWHGILLRLPIFGNLIRTINVARMCRTMGSLLSSGVPIDETLDNLAKILDNMVLAEGIVKVKQDVLHKGSNLSVALKEHNLFPDTLVQIVAIGEESGNLATVLRQLAEQYEEEVSSGLKGVTSAINPILMIVIGGLVGLIVTSMFLPMFSLMDSF